MLIHIRNTQIKSHFRNINGLHWYSNVSIFWNDNTSRDVWVLFVTCGSSRLKAPCLSRLKATVATPLWIFHRHHLTSSGIRYNSWSFLPQPPPPSRKNSPEPTNVDPNTACATGEILLAASEMTDHWHIAPTWMPIATGNRNMNNIIPKASACLYVFLQFCPYFCLFLHFKLESAFNTT